VSRVLQLMFAVLVLLATGFYIFSELVTMLAFVAVLVVFGTSVVSLFFFYKSAVAGSSGESQKSRNEL